DLGERSARKQNRTGASALRGPMRTQKHAGERPGRPGLVWFARPGSTRPLAYFSRITSSIVIGGTARSLFSGHDSLIFTLPAFTSAGTRTEPSSLLPHQPSGFSTPRATTGLPAGSALGKENSTTS